MMSDYHKNRLTILYDIIRSKRGNTINRSDRNDFITPDDIFEEEFGFEQINEEQYI